MKIQGPGGKYIQTIVLFFVALTLMFGVGATSAFAESIPENAGEDLEKAKEILGKDPEAYSNASHFRSLSAADQQWSTRAMAELDAMDRMYTGSDTAFYAEIKGLVEVAGPQLGDYQTAITGGQLALFDGGATSGAIGGGSADLGAEIGLFKGAAGGPILGLATLAGSLIYMDIETGTNPISTALFGVQEDNTTYAGGVSPVEHDVAAEEIRWQSFPKLPNTQALSHELEVYEESIAFCISGKQYWVEPGVRTFKNCASSEAITRDGETVQAMEGIGIFASGCGNVELMRAPDKRFSLLQPKIGGHWYLGACEARTPKEAFSAGIYTGTSPIYKGWRTMNAASEAECGKLGVSWGSQLAGWPSEVGPEKIVGQSEQPRYSEECNFSSAPITTVRAPSRFHYGQPHKVTESEVAEKEVGGAQIIHAKAHPIGSVGGPSTKEAVEKGEKTWKEGGQIKVGKAWKHWMETAPHEGKPPAKGPETSLPGTVRIPGCTGTGSACKSVMEGLTLVPEIDILTWQHANVEIPAGDVVSTSPAEGTEVEEKSKVGIVVNPFTMPKIIPAPRPGETGTQYKERLEGEGYTNVEVKERTEVDPRVGPGEVSYTYPREGTAVDPAGGEKVQVEDNPGSAPPPEGGAIGPPTLPGIKFPKLGVLCKSFPFGVPCWVIQEITAWSATAKAPVWGIASMKIMGHTIPGASFDLVKLEPIMIVVRPAILIFATIGLVLLFYKFAMGGSPDSGSQGDSSSTNVSTPDSDVYL